MDVPALSSFATPSHHWVALVLQGYEIWKALGGWVSSSEPGFGPGIKERFQMAQGITQEVSSRVLVFSSSLSPFLSLPPLAHVRV